METYKMIISSMPFPRKIMHREKLLTLIVFDCYHAELKMAGKRKTFVKLKFTVFSIVGWTMFKAKNLYQQKHIIIKGHREPTLGENAFWATDLQEPSFMPNSEHLFEFEEKPF